MIKIESCSIDNLDSIMDMQNSVFESNKKTGKENWFIVTGKELLEEGLKNNELLILGAFCKDELTAFIAMSFGDSRNMFKELLNNGDKEFVYVKIIIVKEGYRGQGLQRTLLQALENEVLKNPQLKYMGAITHPDNIYSLRNFKAEGYEIKGKVIPDPKPGYPRVLLFKTLHKHN